jgi:hypothetical protein
MKENETEARGKLHTPKPGAPGTPAFHPSTPKSGVPGTPALSAAKSPAEIPPQQNRKHLTEPSWIEKMIYLSGLLLDKEEPKSDDEDPSKSEAA